MMVNDCKMLFQLYKENKVINCYSVKAPSREQVESLQIRFQSEGGAPGELRKKLVPKTFKGPFTSLTRHKSVISQNVSLWNRLSAMQVDSASPAAVCHYFWHYCHRSAVRVGGGWGRQNPLRQYVETMSRPQRSVGLQVSHGVLWVYYNT